MKKRIFLFVLIIILSINLISAYHSCSDGSKLIEDQGEIRLFERKTINEIGLGLVYADESTIMQRIIAELLIDAQKLSLSNLIPSTKVEIRTIEYNVSLSNITSDGGVIRINGVSGSIESESITSLKGLEVFIFNIKGSYPGEGSLDGLIGTKKITLSNDKNQGEIVKINGTDYVLELVSASDNNAIVIVKKCNTGTIVEIPEEALKNATTENKSIENTSAKNITITSNESNLKDNKTETKNNTKTDLTPEKKFPSNAVDFFLIISFILFVILLTVYLINKFRKT